MDKEATGLWEKLRLGKGTARLAERPVSLCFVRAAPARNEISLAVRARDAMTRYSTAGLARRIQNWGSDSRLSVFLAKRIRSITEEEHRQV